MQLGKTLVSDSLPLGCGGVRRMCIFIWQPNCLHPLSLNHLWCDSWVFLDQCNSQTTSSRFWLKKREASFLVTGRKEGKECLVSSEALIIHFLYVTLTSVEIPHSWTCIKPFFAIGEWTKLRNIGGKGFTLTHVINHKLGSQTDHLFSECSMLPWLLGRGWGGGFVSLPNWQVCAAARLLVSKRPVI